MARALVPDDERRRLARLERAAGARARSTPARQAYMDDQGRVRVLVGLQDDGSYGLRVFDSAGVTVYDLTAT